jgi:hypothetical protein
MGQIKHYNNGKWTIYTSGEGLSGYTGVTDTYYVGPDLNNDGNLTKANPDGSLVNLEKPFKRYLGEIYLEGIVFNIYLGEDGLEHGNILYTGLTQTSLQNPTSQVFATSTWDGETNTGLYTNSLAKNWVYGLGGNWYIPAIDELNILYNNKYYINKTLDSIGITQLSMEYSIWSSTESGDSNAFTFSFTQGRTLPVNKTDTSIRVLAIKQF